MDLSSIASSYGESVLNILAERLTVSSVSVKSAYLRPSNDPMSAKIDVTRGFSSLVCKEIVFTDRKIVPQDLLAQGNGGYRMLWMGRRSPTIPTVTGSWWLCVSFSVPGGSSYTVCYIIPEENITFPPQMSSSVRKIMPLNRQVVNSAMIAIHSPSSSAPSSSQSAEEEEEEEEDVIMDLTRRVREMLGPDGTAFGRGWIDVRVAVADTLDEETHKPDLLARILSLVTVGPLKFSITVDTADGEKRPASGVRWVCPQ